jgi:chromosome segregation ATPase
MKTPPHDVDILPATLSRLHSADATIARLSAELAEMKFQHDCWQENSTALSSEVDRLSAELDAAREALAEAGEFIASHISDIEDGQNPKDAEYLALAIKYWNRARSALAKLSAKGA